jgi:SAM-dependent methyltransferase
VEVTLTQDDVRAFYADPLVRGAGFPGQLTDEFQARLARAHATVSTGQCEFYHSMDLGSAGFVEGVWDLRGEERSYLGYVDVARQRVLELGPATGHLTFHMEKLGADVVGFDLAPGQPTDIVPQVGHDLEAQRRLSIDYAERVRNSWWYCHSRLGSKAKAVYGDIYRLPPDLGRFDVAILGSILLHLSQPFAALREAAALTDKAVVVTEPIPRVPPDEAAALLEFAPVDTAKTVIVWWQLMPGAIIRMLRVMGYLEFSVHYHLKRHHHHHEMDKPPQESLYFTIVAERHEGWAPRLTPTDAERKTEREVRRAWSAADLSAAQELQALRSSLSWRMTRPVRGAGALFRRFGLLR